MAEDFIPLLPEEEGNEASWYTAGLAGIASGLIKVPEGVFSLGAELIDLGFDTNTAADVERFFDKLNPFEEIAEQKGIGKLTEALTSIGIPGTAGFKLGSKLATKYFNSKKAGSIISSGSKNLVKNAAKAKQLNEKEGYIKFAAGAIGGAAGETFVADVEDIGTFGDLFDAGPTRLDTFSIGGGREDATRKLLNRIKFGSESLLFTPVVAGVGKSAKALAQKGKELAYSNSRFERYLNKFAEAFTPEGPLTKALFGSQKVMEGFKAADMNRATELVKNIDRTVGKALPQMQKVLERSLTKEEQETFYKELNELILDGDLTKLTSAKDSDKFIKSLKKRGVDNETALSLMDVVDEARDTFANLIKTTNSFNAPELKSILQDRIKSTVKNTYKIFEDAPFLGLFGRYKPTDEVKEKATKFFQKQIADANQDVTFNPRSTKYYQEAREIVDKILEDGIKKSKNKVKGLPDTDYIRKTLESDFGKDKGFISKVISETGVPVKVIKELLGEMSDPRYSIFNAITELSGMARTSAMLKQMADQNDLIQKEGGIGSFWKTKDEAFAATNRTVEIVKIDDVFGELLDFKAGQIANPLATRYTTRPIAEALLRANGITEGFFTSAIRGREGSTAAEKGAAFLWRNLLLFPKATSQLAKTVFSIPTHLRNIISAGAFAAANGILFEGFKNPKLLGDAFRKGWQISGVGNLKATRFKDADFESAYRELLELGVVNSQVQIGDLRNLMRDVNFGDKISNLDSVLNPMLSRLKKIPEYLQGKYVAEDDFWKITNYFVELNRRKNAYIKDAARKKIKFNPDDEEFVRQLKQEAAAIVRNTVPNYAYVGDVVRTARLLPVGNFMSFPSEMIRSTVNIAEQAIKEMKHKPLKGEIIVGTDIAPMVYIKGKGFVENNNPMYSIGVTRATGMAFTLNAVPALTVAGAQALYDVTEDELKALRQFVPEWSRNSTLVPIRDEETNELKYVDFSHSNAYDLIGRPFRTLANEIISATKNGDTILKGFMTGADEAITELAAPFIDESIWTEAAADINLLPLFPGRGGRTRDGKILYTDQTPLGDRTAIKFIHLMEALAPSYKQGVRIIQALTETPTKTGEFLQLDDQIAGLIGFRPTTVDPLRSMGFKIAEYQQGIRNARREFTGGFFGILKGGPIEPNDVITSFYQSNKARFNVQREMHKNINAAEILGVSSNRLRQEFADRQLSADNFNKLRRGNFDAYFPSDDIRARFREIARDLGTSDVFISVLPTLKRMELDMNRLRLDGSFERNIQSQNFARGGLASSYEPNLEDEYQEGLNLNDYLIEEVATAPLPITPMPNSQVILSQASGNNIMATGLTPTESALLTEEEKIMRLKQRGLA